MNITGEILESYIRRVRTRSIESPMNDEEFLEYLEEEIEGSGMSLDLCSYAYLVEQVEMRTRTRLGLISGLMEMDSVQEIMVNGTDDLFIEKEDGIYRCDGCFSSREELNEIIRAIAASVHREFNDMSPILDARLPDGSRVNAVHSNIALDGPTLSIRKFRKEHITLGEMISSGTLTETCARDLKALVACGYNMFISGGTSSGKTTFLNALCDMIPKDERVIIIEDSRELMPENIENIVQMECHNANSLGNGRVTMEQLIRTSLRMRPDRIIVGEVRGREVADMLSAMNTGHDGCLSTGHGNSARGMLRRMETMYLIGQDIPMDAIRSQIVEGIDIMVHMARREDGSRRVVEVKEVLGTKDGEYLLNDLYLTDDGGRLVRTSEKLKDRFRLDIGRKGMEHGL